MKLETDEKQEQSINVSDASSSSKAQHGVGSAAAEKCMTSTPNTNTGRHTSVVWKHFTRSDCVDMHGNKVATCMHCGKQYKYNANTTGTSTLLQHVKSCKKKPAKKYRTVQTTLPFKPVQSASKFDQQACRVGLAEMVVLDDFPISCVEGEPFKVFMSSICPQFSIPSGADVLGDVSELFSLEKQKVKSLFTTNSPRISLTIDTWTSCAIDTWTSSELIWYMCLRAHFIDDSWTLQRKIINVRPNDDDIGKAIEKCLSDWGIDKLMTVTVDNEFYNEAVVHLTEQFNHLSTNILDGKYMHMRCITQSINLVVSDGIGALKHSIDKIRSAVGLIKPFPERLDKFKECAKFEDIESEACLFYDVPTRWDSTYVMLKSACELDRAFVRYDACDPSIRLEMETYIREGDSEPLGMLCAEDWVIVKRFLIILKHFYALTIRVSGSPTTTSNLFMEEIGGTVSFLKESLCSDDMELVEMASGVKDKFDKYCGGEEINIMIFIAAALDPRYKLDFVHYVVRSMYPSSLAEELCASITSALNELYEEYVRLYSPARVEPSSRANASVCDEVGYRAGLYKRMKNSQGGRAKSELERYLNEDSECDSDQLDVLLWWKNNMDRFPIVARMAKDMLAIPISTVSGESAFKIGGQVLDDYKGSLAPEIVERLVCTRDWIKEPATPITWEEHLKEEDKMEQELFAEMHL